MHEVFFMIEDLKPLLKRFIIFAKDNLNFKRPPRLFLKQDTANQKCMLGKTAHYDPANQAVTLYISGRHPKDILRSFAHELVHHCQNERGDLHPDKMKTMNRNYAQENDHMRKMEKEAYLQGNMCFRDWEDGLDDKLQYKMKLAEHKFLKENKTMSVKISKKELKSLIQKLLENKISEQNKCKPKPGETQAQANKRCNAADKARVDAQNKKDATAEKAAQKKDDEEAERELRASFKSLEEEKLEEGGCGGHAPGKRACGKRSCPTCGKAMQEAEGSYSKGQKVMYDGKEVTVEVPNMPGDFIGVKVDGKVKMVKPSELSSADKSKSEPKKGLPPELPGQSERDKEIKDPTTESKIQTPEQENTLYESRFTQRNTRLFEKLLKEWTK